MKALALPAMVLSVTDGDTIKVRRLSTGRRITVRLLGIDAPETVDPGQSVEDRSQVA